MGIQKEELGRDVQNEYVKWTGRGTRADLGKPQRMLGMGMIFSGGVMALAGCPGVGLSLAGLGGYVWSRGLTKTGL